VKCPSCKRHLRDGSFRPDGFCTRCVHRENIAIEVRQRGGGGGGRGFTKFSVNNTFISQNIPTEPGQADPLSHLQSITENIHSILNDAIRMHGAIKFYLTLNMNMQRPVENTVNREVGHFCSIPILLMSEDEIIEQIEIAVNLVLERAEAFLRYGSGWTYLDVKSVEVHSCAYNIVGGTSYIETPPRFRNRSIINIHNKNDRCFEYSVLAGLYPAKRNVCHPSSYKKNLGTLNFNNINFPIKPNKNTIEKFEEQNPEISINVQHIAENGQLGPVYASNKRDRKHHLNLLLLIH
jgi:hypothetical protein